MTKEFTTFEQDILNELYVIGYRYITRDKSVCVHKFLPTKIHGWWSSDFSSHLPLHHLFLSVTCEDKKPTNITYVDVNEHHTVEQSETHDAINPSHYKGKYGLEAIDVAKNFLTDEEFRGFVKGNVMKYVLRERQKNGDEDLKKSKRNLEFLLEKM
ncbi:DUF3310 domain-containing protein [Carnobacteriaceae bacterium zg-ZUI78]|nr:DUF3310 domain-containing protein [Carnobacteriaceae bacterium zg-ZUI78]